MDSVDTTAAVAELRDCLVGPPERPRLQRPRPATAGARGREPCEPRIVRSASLPSRIPSSEAQEQPASSDRNLQEVLVALEQHEPAPPPPPRPARRRPGSAPAGRQGKREQPQVNMNKAAPLGTAPRWTIPSSGVVERAAPRTPGPGQYELASPDAYWCKKKPSFSIGKPFAKKPSVQPGPGNYAVEFKPSGPKCVIGTARRQGMLDSRRPRTPGPGTYEVPSGKSRIKKSISAPVVAPEVQSRTPGPGTYEFADQFHDFTRQEMPKHRFPVAARVKGAAREKIPPGPGDYEISPAGLVQKPRWSHGVRRGEHEFAANPTLGVTYSQFA